MLQTLGKDGRADLTEGRAVRRDRGIYARFGKRALDIALVLLSAPIIAPVVVMLAILVCLDG